jgi:ankyrin repeat protein
MRIILMLCTLVGAVPPFGAAAQESVPTGQSAASPLSVAIETGHVAALQRLLQAGADPNATIPFGDGGQGASTPLGLAPSVRPEALTDVVRVLLAGGADPNGVFGRPGDEATPLMAAFGVPPEVVGLLLDAGADPNIGWCDESSGGVTTLLGIAEFAGDEVADLLRAAGAVTSAAELGYSRSPVEAELHAAVFRGDVAAVERLLRSGSDPNAPMLGPGVRKGEVERFTPLGVALYWRYKSPFDGIEPTFSAEPGIVEIVRLLLNAGADPNEVYESVCTVERPSGLLLAVRRNDASVTKLLLAAGADPNAAGDSSIGRLTPLELALSEGHMEVAALLRAAGAEETSPIPTPASALPRAFEEAFASCTPGAMFTASLAELGVRVRYDIRGPEGDGCRVSMTFESNPNPAWENQPLEFTLDPSLPPEGQLQEGVMSCMSGEKRRFDCGGPLVELLRR